MKEGWKYKPLGEVCEKSFNIKWDDVEEEKLYIDLSSVDRESLTITEPQRISRDNAPSRAKQIVKAGDIIFATTRPTLRRLCIISEQFKDQICSTGYCVLRPKEQVVSKWIFYSLLNDSFYKYIEPLQTGANYPAVTDGSVKKYILGYPSLAEQERIVEYLDKAFEHIDTLKDNSQKQLDDARKLFQAALTEAMQPKEGWETKIIKDISDIKGGKRVPKGYKLLSTKTEHPYIRVSDFTDNGCVDLTNILYISDGIYQQIKNYTITDKDVYISIAGTIGKSGIIPSSLNGANLTENACKIVFKAPIKQRYFYLFTLSDVFKKQIEKATKQASQPKLALTRLAEVKINLPSLAEQHEIVERLDAMSDRIRKLEEINRKVIAECDALKQSILRQIFE